MLSEFDRNGVRLRRSTRYGRHNEFINNSWRLCTLCCFYIDTFAGFSDVGSILDEAPVSSP